LTGELYDRKKLGIPVEAEEGIL
jgi:hypothetical protein